MMKRVLFVDDEERVLQGLGRMLRPMRDTWAMRFAHGGEEALALLAEASTDVLVTDMRMPGMDGAELLSQVRRRFPHTVRIILSGQASREAILHSVRIAHRQLAKPCDAEVLKANVAQACALRELLRDDDMAAMISQVESVPSLPAVYAQLEAELRAPQPSLLRVSEIIRQDLGMMVNLLKIAYSPLFGIQGRVTDPVQAVNLLGLETIQDLMDTAGVFSMYDPEAIRPSFLEHLWAHSQATGVLARTIAEQEHAEERVVEESALAGLLHDVGKLLLGTCRSQAYEEVLTRVGPRLQECQEVERTTFHTTHAEVGALLLGLWGLPPTVVEAVAWHHQPSGSSTTAFGPLTAVHVANVLVQEEYAGGEDVAGAYLDCRHLEHVGLADRLPAWRHLWRELRKGCKP
jgi:HD-like signal output (HDOD) protein